LALKVSAQPAGKAVTQVAREVGSYFTQWGVYGRGYEVADIEASGTANRLTFLNYAFGNVYAKNGGYECGMVTKAEPAGSDPTSPDAGTGGDAYADYGRSPVRTVSKPSWDAPLSGSFAQLKALKALHPQLKTFISLGGWTWSRNFSAAASTDALRKQLVGSCIDLYIRGNLPVQDFHGGAGAAAGVFDGIDVDWEFPGGGGMPYNGVSASDRENYTLLLAEFRRQLDVQGVVDNRHYYLTAAIGAGKDKIDFTAPAEYSRSLDWINVMSYDFHGGWAPAGPTNFNAHLFAGPLDPSRLSDPGYAGDKAIANLITAGVPASKLVLGVPFYGRGWAGVSAGPDGDGLYQAASGAAPGHYEAGIEDYKLLKYKSGVRYTHPVTKQLYLYTGTGGEWWSYDDAGVVATKMQYVREHELRGAFSWSLDGDLDGELAAEIWKGR
jgi:chitinase